MKCLVIVESPAKAKIISKYLNSCEDLTLKYGKFTVVASFGHIRDLKQKELSINIEQGFATEYEVIPDKKKLVTELGKKIKEHDTVLLASDADLEGSAIAWHIREHFKLKKYKRIVFNEITKTALHDAVIRAGEIDNDMVQAQQARRVLDRIVGFKLSPLLWKHYKSNGIGLSAGRVQSAVLKIIVDKDESIKNFKSDKYWSYEGSFAQGIDEAKLYNKDDVIQKDTEDKVVTERLQQLTSSFNVVKCASKTKKVKPDQPFITSTLQQEAYSKMGSSVKRTMKLAQDLYENGYITYMRTDSTALSGDAIKSIEKYITNTFGTPYLELNVSQGKKSKGAQEAHECIRPTDVGVANLGVEKNITKDHIKLYDLIWKRTIASRMKSAVYEELDIVLVNDYLKKKDMYFLGKFKKLEFEGYLRVYGQQPDSKNLKEVLEKLNNAKVQCNQVFARNTWTSPPSRYNESSIIKVLDNEGIGRPATYASILSKLYDKRYVDKLDFPGIEKECIHYTWVPLKKSLKSKSDIAFIGQEKGKLSPTSSGTIINDFLCSNFEYIVNKEFTSEMEGELDRISEGKLSYKQAMTQFWKEFNKHLSKFDNIKVKSIDKPSLEQEKKVLKYKGVNYSIGVSRYGPVLSFKDDKGTVVYKDLKNYLKLKGIGHKDIDKIDLNFVLNVPYSYGNGYELKSGPYGFYIQKNGVENYRIPSKFIDKDNLEALFKLSKEALDETASYIKKK